MHRFLQVLYAPALLFGAIGLVGWSVLERHASVWVVIPAFLLAVIISLSAETWLPYDPLWNRSHADRLRDCVHMLVNETLNAAGVATIPLFAAGVPWSSHWPLEWHWSLQLSLAIGIADFGITAVHYLSHRVEFLWRLHAVHHSVKRMYGVNGLMKHPLHQALEAGAGVLPLLLLGMPQTIAAVLAFAISIQLLLQHSNVAMRSGALCRIFAWAPLHRFHHMRYGQSGDVNFALFFNLWDRLLGTAFDAPRYRMNSDDLGIGSRPDYPRAYLAQLVEPFRRRISTSLTPRLPAGLRRRATPP